MKPARQCSLFIALIVLANTTASADGPAWTVNAAPGIIIPTGDSAAWFSTGFGTAVTADLVFDRKLSFLAGSTFSYSFVPTEAESSISLLGLNAQAGAAYIPTERITIRLFGSLGFVQGWSNAGTGTSSGSLSFGAGVDGRFLIHSDWDIGVRVSWGNAAGLFQALFVGVNVGYALSGHSSRNRSIQIWNENRLDLMDLKTPKPGEGIDILDVRTEPVFPALYGRYDTLPLGSLTLMNIEKSALDDVSAAFFMPRYMDAPHPCSVPENLAEGADCRVDLCALFNSTIMEITEPTDVSGILSITYTRGRYRYLDQRTIPVTILDRNALVWDDDRKAAAFVTHRDPVVQGFATGAASAVRDVPVPGIDPRTAAAISCFAAMREQGLVYRVDPEHPYRHTDSGSRTIDYLQFPRQTLVYQGGDCDDLTVLFCALLESAGIPTALVTVPGHILPAYDTGIPESGAGRWFSDESDYMIRDDRTWIPVEVTLRTADFPTAVQRGMEQIRESALRGEMGFFPVAEAWALYPPPGLTAPESPLSAASDDRIRMAFESDLNGFIDQEIDRRLLDLGAPDPPPTPGNANSRGLVHARYGRYGEAGDAFRSAIGMTEEGYFPALMNMGNLAGLRDDWAAAAEWYERALALSPENPRAISTLETARNLSGPSVPSDSELQGDDPESDPSLRAARIAVRREMPWFE